jgi:hypothetical protein
MKRARHDLLILILVAILMGFAVLSAVAWLIAHVLILAGAALIIGGAFYLGRHGRRQARPATTRAGPSQVQTAEPVAVPVVTAATVPAATVPMATVLVADYGQGMPAEKPARVDLGELTDERPDRRADRNSLLATPMSGVRPLTPPWGPS